MTRHSGKASIVIMSFPYITLQKLFLNHKIFLSDIMIRMKNVVMDNSVHLTALLSSPFVGCGMWRFSNSLWLTTSVSPAKQLLPDKVNKLNVLCAMNYP